MADAHAQNDSSGEAPKKSSTMLLIAGLVGGMVVGGAGGMFAVGPTIAKKMVAPANAAAVEHESTREGEHEPDDEGKSGSVVHMMENLVLNPAGSNGTRFLMTSVAVEVKDDGVKQAMTSRDAEMRDAVLRVLGERTVEQLADMSLRDGLKKQVADSFNTLLARKDAVKRVYFPQFVIQ
jgi:flagellar FliL protein